MNLIVIFLLFVIFYNVKAYFDGERLNVGTVLFKQSDFKKKCWDAAMLDLLEARKYIQNILPSPSIVETVNDKYLEHLLQYFDHSYDVIKREIADPSTRNLMKHALSDAIGGYLKTWVLPVSKYSYYGGTISLDNVLKVTKVYDDIKKELNTDGEGWKKDEELIRYFPIDVATLSRQESRFHEGSCEDLAYYEKSDSGYSVPVPVINWDICPSTMFVPLKSPSLVPLDSPNCSTSLVNYYELIQNCVNNIDNWKDFDDRFQSWLMTDVAPHLSDDCLYVPFGGVLGLMNQRNLPGNFFKSLKSGYSKVVNSCSPSMFYMFSGKKVIFAIIIFVELVWCIPALYYVICCKKKKRKRRWSLLFCFKKKVKKNAFYVGTSTDDDTSSERNYLSSSSDRAYNTINDFQPSIFGTRYNTDTDSDNKLTCFSHQHIPYLDSKHIESKPFLKPQWSKTKPTPRDTVKTECELENRKSLKKSKSRQSHKSKQSAPSSEKVLQDFYYSQYLMKAREGPVNGGALESNNTGTGEYKNAYPRATQKHVEETTKSALNSNDSHHEEKYNSNTLHCPCTNNIRDQEYNNKSSIVPKRKEKKIFKVRKRTTEVRRNEKTVKNENNSVSIRKETAPTLQINIAQPETEIEVDISRYKEYKKRNARPSKIPRFNAAGIKELANENPSIPQKHLQTNWIQVEQAVLNDVVQENDEEKLNVTL